MSRQTAKEKRALLEGNRSFKAGPEGVGATGFMRIKIMQAARDEVLYLIE
jgi:hypothetical protein